VKRVLIGWLLGAVACLALGWEAAAAEAISAATD